MSANLIDQDRRSASNDTVRASVVWKLCINKLKAPESGSGDRFAVVALRAEVGSLAINDDG